MTDSAAPEYSAPALDRALDILEVLADRDGGLTQSELAAAVGRTPSQVFRVLSTLERRGYILRDRQSGLYLLSTRLFDLAHRHEPLRGLIAAADRPMRDLAARIGQSCNLGVRDGDVVRIVAQVESPADFGYRVRVGAAFPLETTATGAVLSGEVDELTRADALQAGITDVVVAVRDVTGSTLAALTVPYVATSFSGVSESAVLEAARETVLHIEQLLRGIPT